MVTGSPARAGAPVLVDTSVLIDHLRGADDARAALIDVRRSGRRIAASVLTRTELLGGMRADEESGTDALLRVFDWIDVTAEAADQAGALARQYRRSHPGIDVVDYVIAATAQLHGAELMTCNIRHFPMFPGIAAPY